MEEQVKEAVAKIVACATIEEAVEAYMSYPKMVRREAYNQLPHEVRLKARAASEKARGIVARTVTGDLVLSKEAAKAQVLRLTGKINDMDTRKALLAERVVEIKKQAQEFHGDEFLAELEAVIEAQ